MGRTAVCGWCLLAIAAAAPAQAQIQNRVAVGLSVTPKGAPGEGSQGATGIGFLWRLGRGADGWGWQYGFNWYSADLHQAVGGLRQEFGDLRVRPFLTGYGYSRGFGRRTRVSANLLGGYAFNSFSLQPAFNDAYRQSFGADTIQTDVSNSFVLKPEISAWLDLSDRIGLNISAGYMIARPTVTVSSSVGQDRRRIRADMVMIKIGAVYSIF